MLDLVFHNRTSEQGSFVWFPDDFDLSLDHFIESYGLIPSQKETISAILESFNHKDSESTVDFTVIADLLNITRNALNRRILQLEKLNIMSPISFSYANSRLRGRIKCSAFVSRNELLTTLADRSEKRRNLYKDKRRNSLVLSAMSQEAGFGQRPDADNSPVVSPVNSALGLLEQSVAPHKTISKKVVRDVYVPDKNNKTHKLLVEGEASYSGRICNADDLMNYYAILSLAHEYHFNSIATHIANDTLPTNATPIYVDDILRVRKRNLAFNSSHRTDTRNSIQSMKQSRYELVGLPTLFADGVELKEGFRSETFRFFENVSPFTEQAPHRIDDENVSFSVGTIPV